MSLVRKVMLKWFLRVKWARLVIPHWLSTGKIKLTEVTLSPKGVMIENDKQRMTIPISLLLRVAAQEDSAHAMLTFILERHTIEKEEK